MSEEFNMRPGLGVRHYKHFAGKLRPISKLCKVRQNVKQKRVVQIKNDRKKCINYLLLKTWWKSASSKKSDVQILFVQKNQTRFFSKTHQKTVKWLGDS
jgi:hypothetical protein